MSKTICWISLFVVLMPTLLSAQEASTPTTPESCRKFVQEFYNWYLPTMRKNTTLAPPSPALKSKSHAFSPELLNRLDEDFVAASKVPDEIVGLDFDPFLNSQDPGERYVAGRATSKGNTCLVEVYGVSSGKKS